MTTPSTKPFVEVTDIRDMLVLLRDGSLRSILEVKSVNFDLKSNDEQTAILRGFQDFLNALDFPLQIVVGSRTMDIEPYLSSLRDIEGTLTNELLKVQVQEYMRFVKSLAELANIMTKKFYIIVPYYAVEAPKVTSEGGIRNKLKSLFGGGIGSHRTITDQEISRYEPQMKQRLAVVIAGLSSLGVEANILGQDDLMRLYTRFYGSDTAFQT